MWRSKQGQKSTQILTLYTVSKTSDTDILFTVFKTSVLNRYNTNINEYLTDIVHDVVLVQNAVHETDGKGIDLTFFFFYNSTNIIDFTNIDKHKIT